MEVSTTTIKVHGCLMMRHWSGPTGVSLEAGKPRQCHYNKINSCHLFTIDLGNLIEMSSHMILIVS